MFRQASHRLIPQLKDKVDKELILGQGPYSDSPDRPSLPDPRFCNLRLALSRVFHASGAAEVVERYRREEEDVMAVGEVHFGNEFVPDSFLLEYLSSHLGGVSDGKGS